MGISRVVPNFYEVIRHFSRNLDSVVPGQLGWVPISHLVEIPQILDVKRQSATNHDSVSFQIRNYTPTDFRNKSELPVPNMPLAPTEEFLITKAKLRLCVLIARANTPIHGEVINSLKKKKHLYGDDFIVLPLYGIEACDHQGGFPALMTDRIRVLLYNQFSYFPRFTPNGSEISDLIIKESIGRFDRLTVCWKHHKWFSPTDVKLTDQALALLLSGLKHYFGFGLDTEYAALCQMLQETLPKSVELTTLT